MGIEEGGCGGGGGEGLEKTLDLRMQELILSTKVGTGEDSSLLSAGGGRNTSDRRTDPNMSCIFGLLLLLRLL